MSDTSVKVWRYHVPPAPRGPDDKRAYQGWGIFLLTSDRMFAGVTDWGNFAYKWNTEQEDFRKFLLSCDNDYIIGKISGGKMDFDDELTRKAIEERLEELEKSNRLTKSQIESEKLLIDEYIDGHTDRTSFEHWCEETKIEEAYELYQTSPPYHFRRMVGNLFPPLFELFKADLVKKGRKAQRSRG